MILPLPTSLSDLSDGDMTFFWKLDGVEASMTFDTGGMSTYCGHSGGSETYEGPFSIHALQRFFAFMNRSPSPTPGDDQ